MNPIDRLLSVVAPHICVRCGREGSLLCLECSEHIMRLPSICYSCGRASRNSTACDLCKHRHHPQHVYIVTAYDDEAKQLIKAFKFEEKRAAAVSIAGMISETLPYFADPPIMAFVPTATSHRRTRGFDHAELLAKEVAKQRGWRYVRLLHRTSQKRQLGASREQRKAQLKGVFRVRPNDTITGKHVLLIDDVVTTGATLNECSKLLYEMGASQVDAAVFARTMEK